MTNISQSDVRQEQLLADVDLIAASLKKLPEPMAEPYLIVVSGLPGTGKSFFCNKLAERLPLLILESDALRKTLFPAPSHTRQESSRLFQTLHTLIERLLNKGVPIVLDATNLSERHREHLYAITYRLNIKLILVRVEAPPDVVYERLKGRLADQKTNSDADWQVYQRMRPNVERIRRHHHVVDTTQDITPALDRIIREATR